MKTIWFSLKILIVSLLIISIFMTGGIIYYKTNYEQSKQKNETELVSNNQIQETNNLNITKKFAVENNSNTVETKKVELQGGNVEIITELDDWRLILVNSENPLPENFSIELTKVNGSKEFDARAAGELLRNDTGYESFRSN